jgi:hypothetical protein
MLSVTKELLGCRGSRVSIPFGEGIQEKGDDPAELPENPKAIMHSTYQQPPALQQTKKTATRKQSW